MKKYLLGILLVLLVCLTGCKTMTEEERAAYETSKQHEYKVVSVFQYISPTTNQFGAVLNQELKYCFIYIGDDGQLHQFDDFEHTEYGLWKVYIGNENKYVVKKKGFDTYRWLYLTEETFKTLTLKSEYGTS